MPFHWKPWFTFSRKERNGITILLCLIAVFLILPYFFSNKPGNITLTTLNQLPADSLPGTTPKKQWGVKQYPPDTAHVQLFNFDPNTLGAAGWKALGLSNRLVETILHYRSKGGRFYKPSDLEKIYGMPLAKAEQLLPYVLIANTHTCEVKTTGKHAFAASAKTYKKIDINLASVEEWAALPGIGPVLSKRIVKFRSSLGSFSSVEQVRQTYGLADSVFTRVRPFLELHAMN